MRMDQNDFEAQVIDALNSKTKPVGSLGRVEELAAQIARVQKTLSPKAETCSLTIFAGDHGMATAGVSAYPQSVTRQMVLNFLAGGAAANVFARSVGATVQVVDAGVVGDPIDHPDLIDRRVARGTRNAIEQSAMTEAHLETTLQRGSEIGAAIQADVACFGEMGIGNTSSASLLIAKILGQSVSDLTGRGTGLDNEGVQRKSELLQIAADRTPSELDGKTALMEYGGFEIAMMVGGMMGAAQTKRIIIVDGFIATAAALCAKTLLPGCEASFIFGHKSAEQGHSLVLNALKAKPLLSLNMRLGEGTGSLLAFPIVKAAAAMLREMASFESAGVSGPA